jgi:hypothetical protein
MNDYMRQTLDDLNECLEDIYKLVEVKKVSIFCQRVSSPTQRKIGLQKLFLVVQLQVNLENSLQSCRTVHKHFSLTLRYRILSTKNKTKQMKVRTNTKLQNLTQFSIEGDRKDLQEILENMQRNQQYMITLLENQQEGNVNIESALRSVRRQITKLNGPNPSPSSLSKPFIEIDHNDLVHQERIGTGSYQKISQLVLIFSFGEVYKATWQGITVAVKQLYQGNFTVGLIDQFRSEVQVMSQLRHPNICQILGASTQDKKLCMILEYYPNNLFQLLNTEHKRPSPQQSIQIAFGIACGMQVT